MMNDLCCPVVWSEEKAPGMTQDKDYAIGTGNDRGRVRTPAEVAAMNSTTAQKVAETGLTVRHPL